MAFFKKIWRPLTALIFLGILIKKGPIQIEQVRLILSQPSILILGLSLFLLQFILLAFRWKVFVKHIAKLKFFKAFKLTLVGQFFSFFIPGGVGGDVIKALELAKDHVTSKSAALGTVIADRVLGLFSMILLSAVFITAEYLQSPTEKIKYYLFVSYLLLAGVTTGLFLAPYIIQKLNQMTTHRDSKLIGYLNKLLASLSLTFDSFRKPLLMLNNLILCFCVQFISIFFMYTVVQHLNVQPPPFFVFFSLCCFGILASAIPLTPAGIGVGQAAFYFLFATFSPEMGEAAVTAVSLFQIFQLFFALFGGLFFALKKTNLPMGSTPPGHQQRSP